MAYQANWLTRIFTIPISDLTLIADDEYDLDMADFHREVRRLEWSFNEGLAFPVAMDYTKSKLISGTTYAPFVEVINNYQFIFDPLAERVNLRGANTNLADSGVLVNNGVLVVPNNSAGNTVSNITQKRLDYGGSVLVDTEDGEAGQNHPLGTVAEPVNNFTDAEIIASENGIKTYDLLGTAVVPPSVNLKNRVIAGHNPTGSIVVLQGGDTTFLKLEDLTVTGMANGRIYVTECIVSNVTNFSGGLVRAVLAGNVVVDDTFTDSILVLQSGSGVAGTDTPVIDMNSSPATLQVRDYNGGLRIENLNQGQATSLDISSGRIILANTCTSGTLVIRGIGELVDESGNEILSGEWNGMTIVNHLTASQGLSAGDRALLQLAADCSGGSCEEIQEVFLELSPGINELSMDKEFELSVDNAELNISIDDVSLTFTNENNYELTICQ